MNRSIVLVFVLVFFVASCTVTVKSVSGASPNSWVSKAPMQQARSGLGVAVVNGKIYAIGGSTQSGGGGTKNGPLPVTGEVVGTNEEYNPAMDTWTFKAPMPTPRAGFAIASYQNKIYCISSGANEVYDPATDTWTKKIPMPTARTGLQANVANGKIYLIGGYVHDNSSLGFSPSVLNEVYDTYADSWTTKAPMPTAVSLYTSAVVDNKIYIIDGVSQNSGSNLSRCSLTQIYDPETDTWHLGAPLPSDADIGVAGATSGVNAPKRIYYVLGQYFHLSEQPYINRVYDPEHDSWTEGAAMPTNRRGFGVAVVNDILYAIGGYTETYLEYPYSITYGPSVMPYATNEQYTPFGYGSPDPSYDGAAPEISVASPENRTYYTVDVALNFTVNEPVSSMRYELDGETVGEVSGNTTLTGLSYGLHNLTVYAIDAAGNTGTSETIIFTVAKEPEPSPATLVAVASTVSVSVVGLGFLFYFKKSRTKNNRADNK